MKLKIAYRKEQSSNANTSFSPSAGKPEKLIAAIQAAEVPYQFIDFLPVEKSILSETHDPDYVKKVLTGERPNGFGNTSVDVAKRLLYTTGSFLAAGIEAFKSKSCVLSPTSGFHHAHYDSGGGFCTFNGLVVAAKELLKIGAKRLSIIDLDNHFGDGSDSLIKKHRMQDRIEHYTFGSDNMTSLTSEKWLTNLPNILKNHMSSEVWLVQLGADPYIHDPLGGRLTMDQLYQRDLIIFEQAKKYGIPVAWNLAGGYSKNFNDVIQIHMNSIKAFTEIYNKNE